MDTWIDGRTANQTDRQTQAGRQAGRQTEGKGGPPLQQRRHDVVLDLRRRPPGAKLLSVDALQGDENVLLRDLLAPLSRKQPDRW
jgi:hypothetical protein